MSDYFTHDARGVIARAIALAQECGSERVLPDHLLVSASPLALQMTGLPNLKPRVEILLSRNTPVSQVPEFSSELLQLFERAFRCSRGQVDELHLLLSIEPRMLNCGESEMGFDSLFSPQLAQALEGRGIQVRRLLERLGGFELLSAFDGEFFQTEAGRQILDLVPGLQQPHLFHLPLLLEARPGEPHHV